MNPVMKQKADRGAVHASESTSVMSQSLHDDLRSECSVWTMSNKESEGEGGGMECCLEKERQGSDSVFILQALV